MARALTAGYGGGIGERRWWCLAPGHPVLPTAQALPAERPEAACPRWVHAGRQPETQEAHSEAVLPSLL